MATIQHYHRLDVELTRDDIRDLLLRKYGASNLPDDAVIDISEPEPDGNGVRVGTKPLLLNVSWKTETECVAPPPRASYQFLVSEDEQRHIQRSKPDTRRGTGRT